MGRESVRNRRETMEAGVWSERERCFKRVVDRYWLVKVLHDYITLMVSRLRVMIQ